MNLMLLYGYRSKKGKIEVDPEEAEAVQYIFQAYINGLGSGLIAEELQEKGVPCRLGGTWTAETICSVLKNEKYTGDSLLQKTYVENHLTKRKRINHGELSQYYAESTHPAIIDHETFDKVQAIMDARRKKNNVQKPTGVRYPLSGKIVCGMCGAHFHRRTNPSRITWQCVTYLRKGRKACPAKQIPEETLLTLTREVLGVCEITEKNICCLSEIRIPASNHVMFVFSDGRTEERVWQDRSRSESWTDEMKMRASEQMKRRNDHE